MKKLFLYLCLPFFLPAVAVAFLVSCYTAGDPVGLGAADLLDLSGPAAASGLDLELLALVAAVAFVVQIVCGISFMLHLVRVPEIGKATFCAFAGCAGVTFLLAVAVAYVVGLGAGEAALWVACGFGVPTFFGALAGWRMAHPYQ